MTESTEEFTDGLSPRVVHHRLPSQHTLDAHQLRVLHRAIDTLAFTAEQYRTTLPRGVAELIDATTSAWQPIMSELIEQQARFNRGGDGRTLDGPVTLRTECRGKGGSGTHEGVWGNAMTDNRTKYVALIVGGTPEEPWDVEREYYLRTLAAAALRAHREAELMGDNARVTSIEEVL